MKKLVPYFLGSTDFVRWPVVLLDFEGVCLKRPAFAPMNFCQPSSLLHRERRSVEVTQPEHNQASQPSDLVRVEDNRNMSAIVGFASCLSRQWVHSI